MASIPLSPQICALRRVAYRPITTATAEEPTESRFGGLPWLMGDEARPLCRHCGEPLPLFLQLNLEKTPSQLTGQYGKGLLQLFYCVNARSLCEVRCEAYAPFAKCVLARRVPLDATGRMVNEASADDLPARRIVGWEAVGDYPHPEELEEHKVDLSDAEEAYYERVGLPRRGDKIGGYPAWVRGGVKRPQCNQCDATMTYVLQIDSDDNLPYEFGDEGCGHLWFCHNHSDVVAFTWSCK